MKKFKYPRTHNLPWSQSNSSDDVWWTQKDIENFTGQEVVVLEKMDGECTTVYPDGSTHARSLDSKHHPSRSYIKRLAAEKIAGQLDPGYRICGENLFAYHSVFYEDLPDYFLVFSIWEEEKCLSWKDTEEICELLNLETVPVIKKYIFDGKEISGWKGSFPTYQTNAEQPSFPKDFQETIPEGYVIRLTKEFHISNFRESLVKYVRPNHVQTDQNWMQRPVVPNQLRNS